MFLSHFAVDFRARMEPEAPVDRWWPVDPASGARRPAAESTTSPPPCYLGDAPLDAVAVIAAAIEPAAHSLRCLSPVDATVFDRVAQELARAHQSELFLNVFSVRFDRLDADEQFVG